MKLSESLSWAHLFPLLFLLAFSHFLVDTMLGILPVYKTMTGLDMGKAGLIVAIGALIGESSQLFFGSFSDRGYRKSLIIGGLVMAMTASLLVYSTGYLTLLFLYLLTAIGSGSFHPSAASLVNQLVPARRGLLMSIFAAGGSLGMATSQLSFRYAHSYFEGHTFYLAMPAIALGLFLIFFPFPKTDQETPTHKNHLKDFGEFFRNPTLRFLYFSQVANQAILWGSIFILPDILKELDYSEWICYGGGHFCFIFGSASMMIPAGYLADKYSARNIMLYAGIVSAITFYFLLFTGAFSVSILVPTLFVLGATLALMNPIAVAVGNRLEPTRSGSVSAFLMGLVWCISEAVGPGGVGLLSSYLTGDDYASVKALAMLGSLFLIQIYATFYLPEQLQAPAPSRVYTR